MPLYKGGRQLYLCKKGKGAHSPPPLPLPKHPGCWPWEPTGLEKLVAGKTSQAKGISF